MFLTDDASEWRPDETVVERLYAAARANRWNLPAERFARLLEASARRAFADTPPDRPTLDRYLKSLHLEDLALACACAEGIESAWDYFVLEYRPILYRAADAIASSGDAREIADSLYGELFGLTARDGERRSHFRYFHGRSSLATWLRAVLAQRYVDRVRQESRVAPLPSDDDAQAIAVAPAPANPALSNYTVIMRRVLFAAIAALAPRDRLRLRAYYEQDLTLAQVGKLMGEHEATVSRSLARTRRTVREQVRAALREQEHMPDAEIDECVSAIVRDPGILDIAEMLGPDGGLDDSRKKSRSDRSK